MFNETTYNKTRRGRLGTTMYQDGAPMAMTGSAVESPGFMAPPQPAFKEATPVPTGSGLGDLFSSLPWYVWAAAAYFFFLRKRR